MEKNSQVSITIGALGIVLTLTGLFPGLVGLETVEGVGVLQVLVILMGFTLMFASAYLFVRQSFYPGMPTTLAQDIGIRLTLTGLLIAAAAGLADVLGFGTHPPTDIQRPLLGYWQATIFIGGILLSSLGVLVYAVLGPSDLSDDAENTTPNGDDNSSSLAH